MADGPDFSSLDAAWRNLIKAVPGMDSPDFEGAFVAGAGAAFSIIYRCGFENIRDELWAIQREFGKERR